MAGLRFPQHGGYCRAAAAMNLLLGVFHVLLPCFRPGEAQGQGIEPIPGVVELWQAEEGELLLPAQADSEEDVEEHPQEQRSSHLPMSASRCCCRTLASLPSDPLAYQNSADGKIKKFGVQNNAFSYCLVKANFSYKAL